MVSNACTENIQKYTLNIIMYYIKQAGCMASIIIVVKSMMGSVSGLLATIVCSIWKSTKTAWFSISFT